MEITDEIIRTPSTVRAKKITEKLITLGLEPEFLKQSLELIIATPIRTGTASAVEEPLGEAVESPGVELVES